MRSVASKANRVVESLVREGRSDQMRYLVSDIKDLRAFDTPTILRKLGSRGHEVDNSTVRLVNKVLGRGTPNPGNHKSPFGI